MTKKWGMADPHQFKCDHLEKAIPHWNQWQNLNIFAKNSRQMLFYQLCFWKKKSSCRRFDFETLCFSLYLQITWVCEFHNSECLRKGTISLPTLKLSYLLLWLAFIAWFIKVLHCIYAEDLSLDPCESSFSYVWLPMQASTWLYIITSVHSIPCQSGRW